MSQLIRKEFIFDKKKFDNKYKDLTKKEKANKKKEISTELNGKIIKFLKKDNKSTYDDTKRKHLRDEFKDLLTHEIDWYKDLPRFRKLINTKKMFR